jgi:hypothetical protein
MNPKPLTRDLPYSLAILLLACSGSAIAQDFGCTASARLMRFACTNDLRDSFYTRTAQCQDRSIFDDACVEDAQAELDDGEEECSAVFDARLELCDALDDAPHEPPFGPAFASNYVDPTEIGATITPNPWFPLVPGNRWTYEGDDEQIVVEVQSRTKLIQGINCLVVTDIVTENGFLVEDTDDWFAQDLDGNVWYCGEIAENYEIFEGDDPEVAEFVDIEGSWKSGRDRAKAGMLLPFEPIPGTIIRQEVRYGDAEDVIEIESVTATESAPGGACSEACLRTRDFTPLDPEVEENKFYAPGIGLIVEIDSETGERVELVEFVGVGS